MKKITTENIICALFLNGFKKIDIITLTLIVNKIQKEKKYEFINSYVSPSLLNYISYDGFSYSIKDNKRLNENILRGYNITLAAELRTRTTKEISDYINSLNYNEIIHTKMKLLKNMDENLKSLFIINDVEQICLDAELKPRNLEDPAELILSKKKLK